MADAKRYVEVSKFTVKDIFDSKHKTRVIELMAATAEACVKKAGKLGSDKPKDKDIKGWTVIGNLLSLGPDGGGTKFTASISVIVATWPDKSIKSTVRTNGSLGIKKGEELPDKEIDRLVKSVTTGAMTDAVKFMEGETPE
jgi:hypothetical protein